MGHEGALTGQGDKGEEVRGDPEGLGVQETSAFTPGEQQTPRKAGETPGLKARVPRR